MPRYCGFCGCEAKLQSDTETKRLYQCDACDAVETISKASGGTWWYHGWKRADGAKLRAPTCAEMDHGKFGWQPDT